MGPLAVRLLILFALPCASAAEAAAGGCEDDGEGLCRTGSAEDDISDAKVMLLQSSIGLAPPSEPVAVTARGGCSSGAAEGSAACAGPLEADEPEVEVVMLQSSIGLKEEPSMSAVAELEAQSEGEAKDLSLLSVDASSGSFSGVGTPECPCIGITHTSGEIHVTINGTNVTYPAGLGSSCHWWDHQHHPQCIDANAPLLDPAWCIQRWCFVDPCNCRGLSSVPKTSSYLHSAKIQDKHVYYSYEACGGRDVWTSGAHSEACVNQRTAQDCFTKPKCSWTLTKGCVGAELAGSVCSDRHVKDAGIWGYSDCPCVGVSNTSGFVVGNITSGNGTTPVLFPSDVGATCSAWDNNNHPDCSGSGSKPEWCTKKWCLVDPCQCRLRTPPKLSTYFVGEQWLGHQVYYSYAACGATDTWTATNNANACVNQQDESSCNAQGSRCSWTVMDNRQVCLGHDLASLCYGGARGSSRSGAARRSSAAVGASLLLLLPLLPGAVLGRP